MYIRLAKLRARLDRAHNETKLLLLLRSLALGETRGQSNASTSVTCMVRIGLFVCVCVCLCL